MPTLVVLEEPADWEERYRLLFERQELFFMKICKELGLAYEVTAENDILEVLHTLKAGKPNEIRH